MNAPVAEPFPRRALYAAAACVLLTLGLTSAVSFGLISGPKTAQAARIEAGIAPVVSRELRFLDQPDGAVLVEDINTPSASSVIAPGSNQGFIRGVLRGLARDRKMRGIDAAPPFRLTLWANGRLSLQDSVTGRTIELDSFGPDNRAAFARLLPGNSQIAAR